MIDDSVVEEPTWQPAHVKWDHPKVRKFIEERYQEYSDGEIAEKMTKELGMRVAKRKVKNTRMDMGLSKSSRNEKGVGVEKVVDPQNPEHVKFVQAHYRGRCDIELARMFEDRFGVDISWKTMRKARLDMGYNRERNKGSHISFTTPERLDYIYYHHPRLRGHGDSITDFLKDFREKFDLDTCMPSLKRKMKSFVNNNGELKHRKPVVYERLPEVKIKRMMFTG